MTDASPNQTEPAEPAEGTAKAPQGGGAGAKPQAKRPARWSDRQPEPAPWYVGRPGGGPAQPGWGVATPPQNPYTGPGAPQGGQPPQDGQPAPGGQPPQGGQPGQQTGQAGAGGESSAPGGAEGPDANGGPAAGRPQQLAGPPPQQPAGQPQPPQPAPGQQQPPAGQPPVPPPYGVPLPPPQAKPPYGQPPHGQHGQPGPYGPHGPYGHPGPGGQHQGPAAWHDPNRYGPQPPQQRPEDPWQRQRRPERPSGPPEPRGPLDLRTRWARGLALGAVVCTIGAIWYSISHFPVWLIGAGAGLVLGMTGLWLGVFAHRSAAAKGKRAPEAVGAIVWSSIASLISLMIIAFSLIFYTQLHQLSDCMRSATTVAQQDRCQTNFQNQFGTGKR